MIRRRSRVSGWTLTISLVLLLAFLAGCAANDTYRAASISFKEAGDARAQHLAPYEYYSAEAYLKEAYKQLGQSDYSACQQFASIAKTRAQEAITIARAKQSEPMISYTEGLELRGIEPAQPKAAPAPVAAPPTAPPAAPPAPAPVATPPAAPPVVEEPAAVEPPVAVEEPVPAEQPAAEEVQPEPAPAAVEEEEEEDKESIDDRIRRLLLEDDDDDDEEE